jgi:hypothetical protein
MKTLLGLILFVAVIFGVWWLFFKHRSDSPKIKEEPISVHAHSGEFNKSVTTAMDSYFDVKSAFVNADTLKAKENGIKFLTLIDSLKLDELKKDTTTIFQSAASQIEDIKTNAAAMLKETDLTEMRQDFRMISENLYPFLKTIKYEGPSLYWQNCPMAFGEGKEANWISNTKEIENPYLGKNHPEFKSSMLHCGETKDTIK